MNTLDHQIAFLITRRNRTFFQTVGPVASTGNFTSYDQMHDEWEQKLRRFETQYMLIFIEDIKLKLAGQAFLPLKPDFTRRLVKDPRLGQVIVTLDSEGFNGLSMQADKGRSNQHFVGYWQIALPCSSSGKDYISEQVADYRLQFIDWLKDCPCS